MAYGLINLVKYGMKATTTDSNNEKSTRTVSGLNIANTSGGSPVPGTGISYADAPIFFNRLWAISNNTINGYAIIREQAYTGSES